MDLFDLVGFFDATARFGCSGVKMLSYSLHQRLANASLIHNPMREPMFPQQSDIAGLRFSGTSFQGTVIGVASRNYFVQIVR
jgi:hypothetical protein